MSRLPFRRFNIGQGIKEADLLRDQGDWASSALKYAEVVKNDPTLAHIWVQYGHALKESKDYDEAENAYHQALKIQQNPDTFLQLGHLYKLTSKSHESEEAYLQAFDLNSNLADVHAELMTLGWTEAKLRARKITTNYHKEDKTEDLTTVAFEISDLVDFIENGRYPTGIQRVQLELSSVLAYNPGVKIVYFNNTDLLFSEVSSKLVERLAETITNHERPEKERREIARRLRQEIIRGKGLDFSPQSVLVNVGTSWGYQNYFIVIRHLKKKFNIRYVPLAHDTIPVLFPEYCDRRLVSDFLSWIDGMTLHADMVLANSENTLSDLHRVANTLDRALPSTYVLTLNGNTRMGDTSGVAEQREADAVLASYNLDIEDYVLMVSTIEPRKNHALALSTWARMVKRNDGRPIPYLVCAGAPGWKNEGFYERLKQDTALAERVIILTNVSEQTLKNLYQGALFTIFPSLYEGWGLPISEALSHGKVPLVSRISAHPEAGGEYAVYFDLDSEGQFQAEVDKLVYDTGYRHMLEQKISGASPLRPWSEIGSSLLGAVKSLGSEHNNGMIDIVCGRYYAISLNEEHRLSRMPFSGEALRSGLNWYVMENWGTWINGRSADMQFRLPDEGSSFHIYLHLHAPRSSERVSDASITLVGAQWSLQTQLEPATSAWRSFAVQVRSGSSRVVTLRLSASPLVKFDIEGDSDDQRSSALAVRGLYVARSDVESERRALIEALELNDLQSLQRRGTAPAVI